MRMLEPEGKLDTEAVAEVNGPTDAPLDWDAVGWRVVEDDVRRLRLLSVQQGRCVACGGFGLLLHADQHPQSPQEWEQWVRVTLVAMRKQHITTARPNGQDDPRLIHTFCRRRALTTAAENR